MFLSGDLGASKQDGTQSGCGCGELIGKLWLRAVLRGVDLLIGKYKIRNEIL